MDFLDDTSSIKRVHREYENYGVVSGFEFLVFAQWGVKYFGFDATNFKTAPFLGWRSDFTDFIDRKVNVAGMILGGVNFIQKIRLTLFSTCFGQKTDIFEKKTFTEWS